MTHRTERAATGRSTRHTQRIRRRLGRGSALAGVVVVLVVALSAVSVVAARPPSTTLPGPSLRPVIVTMASGMPGHTGFMDPTSSPGRVAASTPETTAVLDPAACRAADVRSPVASPTPSVAVIERPVAAFLGDSYTSGYVGAGIGPRGWPAIVSGAFGWQVINRAVPGTGFVNPGWTRQTVASRLDAVIAARPGVVFVAAGHNDRKYGAGAAGLAAQAVLDRLRSSLPDAVIVVVGPIWQDGSPAASIVALRDRLRMTARSIDAIFIDPIAGGWFAGSSHRYIGPDGIHPTDAGHSHIAALVLARLSADTRFPSSATAPLPTSFNPVGKVPACL